MMLVEEVRSTRCFVETDGGLGQVVRVVLSGQGAEGAEVTVDGDGVRCARAWQGRLGGGPQAVEVAVVVDDGHPVGTRLGLEAVLRYAGGETRSAGELEVAEPGWTMYMVPHFHYDPVWWNTQAGYTSEWDVLAWAQDHRESFQHTGLALVEAHMERARLDPDYKFVLAEVDYLKPFWDLYPDRRDELRRLLAEERLEIVGGTYNEPNTNLTGAETAVRSAVYGVGFQRDVMGADPRTAWQLDVFGHDPQFPAIMADCGVTSSSWARGPFHQWGPKREVGDNRWMQFPSEFEWIAPSGTGLLTSYMPNHYGAGWELDRSTSLEDAMERAYGLFCDLAAVSATRNTLLPVGTDYTPPNRWVTRVAREWSRRYAWPRFVVGLPREFFAAVRAELDASGRSPAPQTRDMNPVYTGKDVSFIDTKQAQRLAECALVEAEKFSTFALLLGDEHPAGAVDKAWRQLLFGAHHDGITGSESDQVYLDLLGGWREAYELAAAVGRRARAAVAAQVDTRGEGRALVVSNSLGSERSGPTRATVALAGPGAVSVFDETGVEQPSICSALDASAAAATVGVELLAGDVPAAGYRTYRLVERPGHRPGGGWAMADGVSIANEHYLVVADPDRGGCLSRIVVRPSGREVLAAGEVGNELLVYPEHPTHPRMGEGPWMLLPAGPPERSGDRPATVRAERSVLGERLVVEGEVAGFRYTNEVTVLSGSRRVDLRTRIQGWKGVDRLVRLRFPTSMRGGTPISEVADAVVARGCALIEADAAEAPWTLDNPAQGWFGLGTTLALELAWAGQRWGSRALGVAEVVTPSGQGAAGWARELMVQLVRKGVTATCGESGANRYGGLAGDSNLPDFRIVVGRPDDNEVTAAVLAAADPGFAAELERQLAERDAARVLVPARRPLAEVWVPNADVRGVADLPVLIVAGADGEATARAVADLAADIEAERLVVEQPPHLGGPGDLDAPEWTVALLNRGTPGFAVDTAGALHVSLLRSCTGWPSGVWIDPPRRTAPDGSNFELEHWDHTFELALLAGEGDWRELGCVQEAQAFNTPLVATVEPCHDGVLPPVTSLLDVGSSQVVLAALKPAGNPLASGRAAGTHGASGGLGAPADEPVGVTARLYESSGRPGSASLRLHPTWSIETARSCNLLEEETATETVDDDGGVALRLGPGQLRTVCLDVRRRSGRSGSAPTPTAPAVASVEPAQPVFSRYWLHNKGPAPIGNQTLAVHVAPRWLRAAGGVPFTIVATVASGAPDRPLPGRLEIVAPDSWEVDPPSRLFRLAAGAHSQLAVSVRAPAGARTGRYFLAARVADADGQLHEDVVTVDLRPEDPDGRRPAAGVVVAPMAELAGTPADELEVTLSTEALSVTAGTAAEISAELVNRTRSAIRAEAQLISPVETWSWTSPWTQGIEIPASSGATVAFDVRPPADAAGLRSWLLVKVMWFGRLWYSPAVDLHVARKAAGQERADDR